MAKPTQSITGALDASSDSEEVTARRSTDGPADGVSAGSVMGGKYRLISEIGRGGMGSVWRAEHLAWEAPVALKIMSADLTARPEALGRFEREVRLAAGLRSPHVVQVLDHGVDAATRTPFIAMELLEGETLARRLKRAKRLSPAETFGIISHLVRALTRAHAAGIVHRDLKPDNVFLVDNEEERLTKVLDFGVAKWTTPALPEGGLTRPGSVLGTPFYMSPEQIQGSREIDHRADLWSLSAIACECLTGRRPFEANDFAQLAVLLLGNSGRPLPSSLGPVPPGFDAWFLRATGPDISQRFQTAREMAHTLAPICGVTPQSLAPDSYPATEELGAASRGDLPSMAPVSHTASRAVRRLGFWRRPLARLVASTAVTTVLVTGGITFWYRNFLAQGDSPATAASQSVASPRAEPTSAGPAATPSAGSAPQAVAPPQPAPDPVVTDSIRPFVPAAESPAGLEQDGTAGQSYRDRLREAPAITKPPPRAKGKRPQSLEPRRPSKARAPTPDDARPTPTSKTRNASQEPPAEAAAPSSGLVDGRRIRTTLTPSP